MVSKVRVSKKDISKLKRLERNVKAKQYRLRKVHHVEENFNFKSLSDIKSGTRKELNNYYSKLQHFTNRNYHRYKKISDDFSVPMNEYKQFVSNVDKANKQRSHVKKLVDSIVETPNKSNDVFSYYQGILRNPKMHFLDNVSKDLSMIHDKYQWHKKFNLYSKYADSHYSAKSVALMKKNYLNAINNSERGLMNGHNKREVHLLSNRIKRMPLMMFYAMYLSDDDLDFTFIYEYEDRDLMVNKINSAIDLAQKGTYTKNKKNIDKGNFDKW